MTRVLITSLNYAPEPTGIAVYTTGVAEHLASQGYQVTVLAGMPHYPAWRVDRAYRGRRSFVERIRGVEVRRSWQYVPRRQSALGRALYEATSLSMALALRQIGPPEAVVGITPSVSGAAVARIAARRFGVPYGVVFQDLAGHGGQSGLAGVGAAAAAATLVDRVCARGAAAVGIVAEGFRPYVESLGVDPGRIRRLRNWTRPGAATVGRRETRQRLGWPEDAFVCLHAGNMGYKQGLEKVIGCAREARDRGIRDLLFALCGDGSQRAALVRTAADASLDSVRFLPLQPEEVFPSMLAAADALLVNQRASVRDMALPSKLTAYFASGRPVIAAASAHSETAREVASSSAGIVAPPDDPRALLDAVLRLRDDAALRAYLGERGRAYAADVLAEAPALRAYEQFVAAILAAGGRGRVHHAGRTPVMMPLESDGRGRPSDNRDDGEAA